MLLSTVSTVQHTHTKHTLTTVRK